MTLRTKTILILSVTYAALLAAVYVTASQALLRGFVRLENENVERGVQRASAALAKEVEALDAVALEWSRAQPRSGDAAGGAPSLPPPAGVDFVVLADPDGSVLPASVRDTSLMGALAPMLGPASPLVRHAHTESSRRGVVLLGERAALIASRPFPFAAGPGAGLGAVVVGRFLDGPVLERITTASQASLSVRRWSDPGLSGDFAAARAALVDDRRTLIAPLAEGWVAGYRLVSDISGEPALLVRLDAPRSILAQGRASLHYLMVSLLVVAVTFLIVPYVLLERTVLRRLAALAGSVADVGAARSFTARVAVSGRDELAALANDINEMLAALERAQGSRSESEARYRAVFEQSSDGIVLFEPETGRVLDANGAFFRLLGSTPGEVLDGHIMELAGDDRALLQRHLAEVLRERRAWASETGLRRKDGTALTVEVASTVVALRGHDVVCSVVRDISQRRLIERRMQQSQKLEAVGRLAAGVAHDFNNLLQSVAAQAGQLRSRGESPEVRERVAGALATQVTNGAALTRQLLLIARQERFAAAPLELNAVVREISDFLRRVVRENIHFDVELTTGELPVLGDRARLEQCLINLVANASDAMPAGGTISVRTGRVDGAVWFEVGDQGHGVAPDLEERIFEPFFTTRSPDQHVGLGLTVVGSIVAEHRGAVAVSARPGGGSAFRVTVPAAAAVSLPAPPAPVAEPAAGATGGRILLVEDGEETRRSLGEMLSLLGYEVEAVGSGEEAASRSALASFDLLLTDYMLPGINGAELARVLLERQPTMGVIVMSGYAAEEAILAAMPGARVRFLPKPFGMETLSDEVCAALSRA